MANNSDQRVMRLLINASDANDKIAELKKNISDLHSKADRALVMGDKGTYDKLQNKIKSTAKQLDTARGTLKSIEDTLTDLDKATPKKLATTIREIKKQLEDVERGSDTWNMLTESMARCQLQQQKLRDEQKALQEKMDTSWGGIATKIQNAFTPLATLRGVFTAVVDGIGGFVREYAELQSHMADVTKYSGLAAEAVDDLNESFRSMDTRTSRAALNDLAADAGRLGIQSKDDILAFVEAADQINVALGEDLGEGAVKNIGKLADMFGESSRLGLKEAMLATGSTINELAQSSSASEGYIMEFTNRLAGMANQAGLTQAQIMAFAAVMDQNSVNVEKGATALQNVITALFQNPAKYAAAAGLEVQSFTNLLRTDANEAVLTFLTALQNAGGMDTLAPMLKEMGLTGAGVTQTLSTLARTVDDVRATQAQATAAYEQATSVTNEFNTANNTVEARLDKAEKGFADLRTELGKQLLPVYETLINSEGTLAQGLGNVVAALSSVIKFVANHVVGITALIAAYATYQTTIALVSAAQKAHTVITAAWTAVTNAATIATNAATAATKALSTALKASPWGLIATAVTLAVGAIAAFISRTKEATAAEKEAAVVKKDLADIEQTAAKDTQSQISRIRLLSTIVHDNNQKLDARRAALKELQQIVPAYTAQLTNEGNVIKDNTAALNDYIARLKEQARVKAAADALSDVEGEQISLESQRAGWLAGLTGRRQRLAQLEAQARRDAQSQSGIYRGVDFAEMAALRKDIAKAEKVIAQIDQQIAQNETRIARISDIAKRDVSAVLGGTSTVPSATTQTTATTPSTGGTTDTGSSGTGTKTETANEASLKRSKEMEEQTNRELLALRIEYQSLHQMSYTEYVDAVRILEQQSLEDRMALFETGSTEYTSLYNQWLDRQKAMEKEAATASLKEIETEETSKKGILKAQRDAGTINEKQYQNALNLLTLEGLRRRIQLYQKYGDSEQEENYRQKLADVEAEIAASQNGGTLTGTGTGTTTTATSLGMPTDTLSAGFINTAKAWTDLKEKIGSDAGATWQDYAAMGIKAVESVSASLSTLASWYQTEMNYEVALVTQRYDAEIKKVGSSTKKGKKLEEQKQAEIAKIKNKYNKKQMAVEIAQATATIAMNAIKAYGAMAGIPVVGPALGAIAAAAAIAAGAVQIASIKKAHATEQAGYYEGGYTGGTNYRRRAGVVHEGEFVANHQAVNNAALSPFFEMIDTAQRNNRVASLTADDVSRALTADTRTATAVSAPLTVTSAGDAATAAALERLNTNLEQGTLATVVIDGPDGLDRQYTRYKRLKNR